jgi:Cd2+/Zn2+-exporting ATPase
MKEFYTVAIGIILVVLSFVLDKKGFALLPEIFAVIALVILGGPIIIEAVRGLLQKELNVDELVSLAIIASAVIGEYLLAATVALIMVIGSLLEEFTAQKARSAIDSLIQLVPEEATLLRGEEEVAVPIKELQPGDRLLIRTGEKVPVDLKVVKGQALLDQASLTGESDPVEKTVGDDVYAGTVIYSGMLEGEAQKVGTDTTLGKLISLVQEAEKQKAPVLRIADRYAGLFTPVIIVLGLIVFLITKDIYRTITVFIVGCPCAFILASPTAVVSALGNASRNGILIKGGNILEEASRIDTVLFDKTGTLTSGKPIVSAIEPLNSVPPETILSAAASVERYSTHPLARAILEAAEQENIALSDPRHYKNLPGRGVEAVVEDKKYVVGRMEGEGLQKLLQDPDRGDSEPGRKAVAVWEEDIPIGIIYFEEKIRSGSETLVKELDAAGISKIQMITGDDREIASRIAKKVGIPEYHSGVLPAEKLEQVKTLQREGYKVAMVGDGINDAPSLAAADIGISMGAMGTDAAIEAADVALMGDDLARVPYFLNLSRSTVRTIKINILFAMVFNILALIASGAGYLTPVTGALAHNIGSIIVVINSARLIRTPGASVKTSGAPVKTPKVPVETSGASIETSKTPYC